jgi:7-cyano-7-deazaguanine synthase
LWSHYAEITSVAQLLVILGLSDRLLAGTRRESLDGTARFSIRGLYSPRTLRRDFRESLRNRKKSRDKTVSDHNLSPAVVLVSGGIDSYTCGAVARTQGRAVFALSFRYQQRHQVEIAAAAKVASDLRAVQHLILDLPLGRIGGSALTSDIQVPKDVPLAQIGSTIPATYVPARNTIFLSLALAWAEVLHSEHIFIGVNALDYSGYPDCRPEYIEAFERMANLATKAAVEGSKRIHIHTPLIDLTKAQIIRWGVELGLDYGMTHSCYDPDAQGRACGRCDSCELRKQGFAEAGVDDPTVYVLDGV